MKVESPNLVGELVRQRGEGGGVVYFAVSVTGVVAVVKGGGRLSRLLDRMLIPCFNTYRIRVVGSLIRPTSGPETIDLRSVWSIWRFMPIGSCKMLD